jgi:hypothetical protein
MTLQRFRRTKAAVTYRKSLVSHRIRLIKSLGFPRRGRRRAFVAAIFERERRQLVGAPS